MGAAIVIFGCLQKVLHEPSADLILQIGFGLLIVFVGLAVFEIMQSTKIKLLEKVVWVFGLLFMTIIVGFVYINKSRKHIY